MLSKKTFETILKAFDLIGTFSFRPFGTGLINDTYMVEGKENYILQKVNTKIFIHPEVIAKNLSECGTFLAKSQNDYPLILSLKNKEGGSYFVENGSFWRISPFVSNTTSYDTLQDKEMAYEAGKSVGQFSAAFNNLNPKSYDIKETIPRFHDLRHRFNEFESALQKGKKSRIEECKTEIDEILSLKNIVNTFDKIVADASIPTRVQHHDTKISNILFDKSTNKGVCMCDLDTVMYGYFISDLGDMMRTYLCQESEEETNLDKVFVRPDFLTSVLEGYLSQMDSILVKSEKALLYYSGEFMIYMQALRFLTDYLLDDIYYHTTHPKQNLARAKNQLKLLRSYNEEVAKLPPRL